MFLIHIEVTDQNPVLNSLSEQVRLVQSQTYRLHVQYNGVKQKNNNNKILVGFCDTEMCSGNTRLQFYFAG